MWETISTLTPVIAAFITGVAGPIILWWLKEPDADSEMAEEPDRDFSVDEEIKFARSIKDQLEEVRDGLNADRTWIAQFHNGGRFLNSREESMKRISVTYEVTGPGVSKERNTFSEILVSFFSEMIKKIIEDGHIYYNEENIDKHPEVEVLFRQRGTKAMHLLAMRNIEGVLTGILGVEYITNGKEVKEELSEKEIQYLKAKSNLIGGCIFYGEVQE